ncbi:unnamed protein product, partial [Mesorhabditis belari]|uniref:G-protein coupled receptors family 1 profile domain-containing protein n=1 Tax=Mesorhabditis belari TaxID=2138241 RepID=A0AAF3J924_9BILA
MSNLTVNDLWPLSTTTVASVNNSDLISDQNLTNVLDWFIVYGSTGIYLSLLGIALFFITTFIVVLIHGRELFKEYPLFIIIANLIAANELNIFCQWTTVVPMMLFNLDSNFESIINQIGGILTGLSEEAATYFTFLIAVNRLIIFLYPVQSHWFKGLRLKLLCLANWGLIGGITGLKNAFGLTRHFGQKTMTFYVWSTGADAVLNTIFTIIGMFIPFVILIIYSLIYFHIRRQRGKRSYNKTDVRILKEAAIIGLCLELARVSQYIIPQLRRPLKAIPWLRWFSTIFLNVANIANHSINSILFLFHNRIVKRAIYGILRKDYVESSGDQNKHLQDNTLKKNMEKEKSRSSSAPPQNTPNIN